MSPPGIYVLSLRNIHRISHAINVTFAFRKEDEAGTNFSAWVSTTRILITLLDYCFSQNTEPRALELRAP